MPGIDEAELHRHLEWAIREITEKANEVVLGIHPDLLTYLTSEWST